METPTSIRLLAPTNNKQGDLFTRLTKDLFFALGYDDLRLDVHKSGRELDIQGKHRLEPRRIVAECKAHAVKIGGEELNKFFGVLTRERNKLAPTPVTGYFVSLSGFTETSIEQENETGDDRIILLNARQVISELERSRVIVSVAQATERAGQCALRAALRAAILDSVELLGHQQGYVWAVYYTTGKQLSHLALIYADGTPLAEPVARNVIDADREIGGMLHSLTYLAPATPALDRHAMIERAAGRYREWIAQACGYIQLDGLPADSDLSSTRLKLERLFIPLMAFYDPGPEEIDRKRAKVQEQRGEPKPIGKMLEQTLHLALLASPGGGKSTLLKRLATAYAFPERRSEVNDGLPERDWLPLLLRCRELRDRAHRPILELLDDIPRHSGMSGEEAAAFSEFVHESLRDGRVLFLIDGLDEISEEGALTVFVNHLRTFVAMFPQIALVVTSREAGFRLVAGVVASACEQAKLAPLRKEDVVRLCEDWHREVIGDNEKVRIEARELGSAIWNDTRVRSLAENPLLLTTILVVKRWIGELPRGRAALYREAVRVLIRTWNVEGYAPLDEDETLAQLSYVACAMMEQGKQQLGQAALLELLQQARKELEAELQFTRTSAREFINRIEYRSSLLMQTGRDRIGDALQPVYEFRHLTFQEYLAARGYFEEQYHCRDSGRSLADIFEPHFNDERWREVIPLAAVLAGRKAEELIRRLITVCEQLERTVDPTEEVNNTPINLLRACLLDEVQVSALTLKHALREVARHGDEDGIPGSVVRLRRGKFGQIFQEIAEQAYFGNGVNWCDYRCTVGDLAVEDMFQGEKPLMTNSIQSSLDRMLKSRERISIVRASEVCLRLAFWSGRDESPEQIASIKKSFESLRDTLASEFKPEDKHTALSICHALVWIGANRLSHSPPAPNIIRALYRTCRDSDDERLSAMAGWALACQPILPQNAFHLGDWSDAEPWIYQGDVLLNPGNRQIVWGPRIGAATLVIAYYLQFPWNEAELKARLARAHDVYAFAPTASQMLSSLGEPDPRLLSKWKREIETKGASINASPRTR